ncbi:helix-turn-helix domain-containing protein [uncultured Proteiniphilum sp.]|uniref:IclR family transcriptional regulator n=1 Tax=uncultured Proteiniphilum sp. TaxID=497637 RepID=UPI002619D062|nr:helix-turn-helix domain-containing protein [uncultured Proteiniphilum sp.]
MIQVIHRALNILELLAENTKSDVSLSEIADTLHLNHSTCANILKTLVNRDYVEQVKFKGNYRLGYMAHQLANSNPYDTRLINVSKLPLEILMNEINETIILSKIQNDKRVLLKEINCNHEVQVKTSSESSVYKATTGRVILAHYSPKEFEDFFQRVGLPSKEEWPEVETKLDLVKLLNDIRKDQFAFSHNNHVIGLATPIYINNKIYASLGIYLPDIRFGASEKVNMINALKRTANTINNELKLIH